MKLRNESPKTATSDGNGSANMKDSVARLRVTDVSKSYGEDEESSVAVERASFEVRAGEFVSLVGPSGCGKTTLLKACAGLTSISSGSIDYDGTGGPAVAGRYGMVFQTSTLLPWSTILQNVLLPAKVLRLDMKAATERARDLLHLVGLEGVEEKYPGELSGGMQQRASLARSLLHEPDLVFMDEPFGALDAITRDTMNALLQRLQRELQQTILFVTHSIQEAVWLSDRVLVMSKGPGRIINDVEIDFARPRDMSILADERFRQLEVQLKQELNDSLMAPTEMFKG